MCICGGSGVLSQDKDMLLKVKIDGPLPYINPKPFSLDPSEGVQDLGITIRHPKMHLVRPNNPK